MIPPVRDLEIVEIVQEMTLEKESEPYVAEIDTSIIGTELPEYTTTETPVEAESKPLNEMTKAELLTTIKEREIDAAAEITALEAEEAWKAEIEALKAKLAELEK